jgi:hypothetical protein
MWFRETRNPEQKMSTVETAGVYVRRLFERETRGWGDQTNAGRRLEARYGIRFNTLEHLRTGRAKSVDAGLFTRIRAAYLDLCERQVRLLQEEIATQKAIYGDDDYSDLDTAASELAARVQAKKAGLK